MASQSDGFWYDFSRTDTSFQESVGPPPADGVGEAIGLTLSQRLWAGRTLTQELAAQGEANTNWNFASSGTDWVDASTAPSSITFSTSGAVQVISGGAIARLRKSFPTVIGRSYRIEMTGTLDGFGVGTTAGGSDLVGFAARKVAFFTATGTTSWFNTANSVNGATVTSVSVKEVSRYPATQTTAASRPTLALVPTAFGPELVTNGTFDTDTNWTKGTGWTITGGVAQKAAGTASNLQQFSVPLTTGRLYQVEFTVSGRTAGDVAVRLDNASTNAPVSGTTRTTNGTFVEYLTAGASPSQVRFFASTTFDGAVDNISVTEVTASYNVASFDGTADNLLTGYTAGSGANFIVAKVTVPASIAATQVIAGAEDAAAANKFWLAISNTGLLRVGLGTSTALFGSSDIRGQTTSVGVSFDGSSARLFVGQSQELSTVQTGVASVSTPVRLAAVNSNGTPTAFFGGSIKSIVAGREFIDLARFNQIAAAL